MKTLFFSCIISLSILSAEMPDGFVERYIAPLFTSHTKSPPPEPKDGEILGHAEVATGIPSGTETLEGPEKDPAEALKNKNGVILAGANVPNPARDELQKQESIEDLKYGPIAGQGPNEDESLKKADLDLKLYNPNPNTDIVRNAALAT